MKCIRCGAETSEGLCSVCGVKPKPELIVGYSLLPQILPRVSVLRSAKAFASRTWGEYHRFLRGGSMHPGEQELYRVRLPWVSAYAVDGPATVARNATCLVTTKRVLACDVQGGLAEVRLGDIRAVRVRRQDDPLGGPSYSVAIERVGTTVRDPEGDIGLHCRNRSEADELASMIGRHAGVMTA